MLSIPSKRWLSTATKQSSSQLVKHHVCLRNSETAAKVAEAFVPAGTRDKVVIEAFPGTKTFLDLLARSANNSSCRSRNIDACLASAAEGTDTQDYCTRER